jgi:hypothetical protein
LHSLSAYFVQKGASVPDAMLQAKGQLMGLVSRQAAMMGYLDVFWMVSWLALVGVALVFCIKPFKPQAGVPAGH